jgi:hypothetical protein
MSTEENPIIFPATILHWAVMLHYYGHDTADHIKTILEVEPLIGQVFIPIKGEEELRMGGPLMRPVRSEKMTARDLVVMNNKYYADAHLLGDLGDFKPMPDAVLQLLPEVSSVRRLSTSTCVVA